MKRLLSILLAASVLFAQGSFAQSGSGGPMTVRPFTALGYYEVATRTPTYTALAAGAPLIALRNPSATVDIVVLRVRVTVITTAVFSTAGGVARELIIARSWTVADTGTTLTLTNNKRRASMAASIADLRHGGPLTAGTRTLDGFAQSQAVSWGPLTYSGVDLAAGPANIPSSVAGTSSGIGGLGVSLLDALSGGEYPIFLVQNEGILIRIGPDAMPTTGTQQTYWEITWAEVAHGTY